MTILNYTNELEEQTIGVVSPFEFLTNSWDENNESIKDISPYYIGDDAYYNEFNDYEPYSNNQINGCLKGETI